MEYIYAALLLYRLKKEINEDSIRKIVQATGVKPDDVKIKALVSALSEVNIDEALKTPLVAPITAQSAAPAAPAEAAKEKPAEEKKEEKKEEEALAGLSSLFG